MSPRDFGSLPVKEVERRWLPAIVGDIDDRYRELLAALGDQPVQAKLLIVFNKGLPHHVPSRVVRRYPAIARFDKDGRWTDQAAGY